MINHYDIIIIGAGRKKSPRFHEGWLSLMICYAGTAIYSA